MKAAAVRVRVRVRFGWTLCWSVAVECAGTSRTASAWSYISHSLCVFCCPGPGPIETARRQKPEMGRHPSVVASFGPKGSSSHVRFRSEIPFSSTARSLCRRGTLLASEALLQDPL